MLEKSANINLKKINDWWNINRVNSSVTWRKRFWSITITGRRLISAVRLCTAKLQVCAKDFYLMRWLRALSGIHAFFLEKSE